MSDPAASKVPCPVHMSMHPNYVIEPDSPEKGFKKGQGYEKMKTDKICLVLLAQRMQKLACNQRKECKPP